MALNKDGDATQSAKLEQPKLSEGTSTGEGKGGQLTGGSAEQPGESGGVTSGEQGGQAGAEEPAAKPSEKPEQPTAKPSSEPQSGGTGISKGEDGAIAVIAVPDSVEALVNPFNKLPEDYSPDDLVYPDVRFTFSEKIEKRMLRKEASGALEDMFAGAESDGVYLAGVSAYRSHETQKALFDRYVKRDGYKKARTYSALPGTSEHETGLAIDISGSDGKCAAQDCFGETKEADWLAKYAAEYGFIIRYPKGKQDITGYQYEPWHLRYVGKEIAKEISDNGSTLEEYYDAVPVKG